MPDEHTRRAVLGAAVALAVGPAATVARSRGKSRRKARTTFIATVTGYTGSRYEVHGEVRYQARARTRAGSAAAAAKWTSTRVGSFDTTVALPDGATLTETEQKILRAIVALGTAYLAEEYGIVLGSGEVYEMIVEWLIPPLPPIPGV